MTTSKWMNLFYAFMKSFSQPDTLSNSFMNCGGDGGKLRGVDTQGVSAAGDCGDRVRHRCTWRRMTDDPLVLLQQLVPPFVPLLVVAIELPLVSLVGNERLGMEILLHGHVRGVQESPVAVCIL